MDSDKVKLAKDFIKWHIYRSADGELTIPKDNKTNSSNEALFEAINELKKEDVIVLVELSTDKITIKLKR